MMLLVGMAVSSWYVRWVALSGPLAHSCSPVHSDSRTMCRLFMEVD
jgi:hypothetical protein